MPQFKERPQLVQAIYFGGGYDNAKEVILWLKQHNVTAAYIPGLVTEDSKTVLREELHLKHYDQTIEVVPGRWIVLDHYATRLITQLSDDMFHATYEYEKDDDVA